MGHCLSEKNLVLRSERPRPSTESRPVSVHMNCSKAVALKLLFFLPMQTTKNVLAKGTTGQEMKQIIEIVHRKALEEQRKAKDGFKGGVRVCWDNARPHKWAEKQLPKRFFKFVSIPPYSPDFNKVIEHRFNHIKRVFQQRVFDDPRIRTFKAAAKLLKTVVEETVTPDIVMKDASTMKQTLRAVYDADGGWPPHDLL